MLLNRSFLLIAVLMCMGCVDTLSNDKANYRVDFKKEIGKPEIDKLEAIMVENDISRIKNITVYYKENYRSAAEIRERLNYDYGINSKINIVSDADFNVSVIVENSEETATSCYQYKVDDFDWYKSSYEEMKKYEEEKICPITFND